MTKLVPSNALVIDEKTWMAFPYIRTTISIPFFNKVHIKNDNGWQGYSDWMISLFSLKGAHLNNWVLWVGASAEDRNAQHACRR